MALGLGERWVTHQPPALLWAGCVPLITSPHPLSPACKAGDEEGEEQGSTPGGGGLVVLLEVVGRTFF